MNGDCHRIRYGLVENANGTIHRGVPIALLSICVRMLGLNERTN
jgi:hypothetical protein